MEFLAFENGVLRDSRYREDVPSIANKTAKKVKLLNEPVVSKRVIVPTQRRQLCEGKRPFSCNPKEVIFRDFDVGLSYTTNVKLSNITNSFNCFRVLPFSPEYSDVISVNYELPPRIAAGLSWDIQINFCPQTNEDISTKLQIATESGYFFLPVRTLKKRAFVTVECSEVDFGTLTLGDNKRKTITLSNNGASVGPVYISGSFKKIAEKMHVDPVSKQEFPFLIINPLMYRVDVPPFSKFQIDLVFAPYEEVELDCTIIFSDRHEGCGNDFVVAVRGQATSLPVHVSSLALNFSWCFYGCTYSGEVSIMNSSNITAIVEPEVPKELQSVIKFDPKMVCIQAGTELNLIAYFTPQRNLGKDFSTVIDFNVKGQTLPATVKIVASLTHREPCVNTSVLDISPSFVCNEMVTSLTVTNQSDLPQMVGFPRLPENIVIHPQIVTMLPKEKMAFKICIVPPHVGNYSQQIALLNEYGDKRSIEISGCGTQPTLKFSAYTILLPTCPLDSTVSATTVVKNTTKEYRHFSFQVEGDYISVSPSSGALRPGDAIPIVIFFIPPPEFFSLPVEPPAPPAQKPSKRKRAAKAHVHARDVIPGPSVEAPKISSYIDWEDPNGKVWSKHKWVLLKCTSSAATDNTEEVCFLKLRCTATNASVVARTLLATKPSNTNTATELKLTKISKKSESSPAIIHKEVIDVSPFKCTLVVDFGEVTLNQVTQKICFMKSNEELPTLFQLRPVDLVSPFTVVRYPDRPLLPGEEDIVIIQFQPSEYGLYSDVITFSSSLGNDIDIFLSGACCCTDLVVSLSPVVDMATLSYSVETVPIPTTIINETTSVSIHFYNRGAFDLDVSVQLSEDADWTTRRTYVIHPDEFIVPPKGNVVCNCLFTPRKEGVYQQQLLCKAGGFEHKLQLEGRGSTKSIFIISPSEQSAVQDRVVPVFYDRFYGRSFEYPFHLHFSRGEVKKFTFGSVKGGPSAECSVDQWSDMYTHTGWSVSATKLSVASGSQTSITIQLSHSAARSTKALGSSSSSPSSAILYCRFCINLRCPGDSTNDTVLYLCCTGN